MQPDAGPLAELEEALFSNAMGMVDTYQLLKDDNRVEQVSGTDEMTEARKRVTASGGFRPRISMGADGPRLADMESVCFVLATKGQEFGRRLRRRDEVELVLPGPEIDGRNKHASAETAKPDSAPATQPDPERGLEVHADGVQTAEVGVLSSWPVVVPEDAVLPAPMPKGGDLWEWALTNAGEAPQKVSDVDDGTIGRWLRESQLLNASAWVRAVLVGLALQAKKKQLGHGGFLPWLDNQRKLSKRTAQRYMRLTKRASEQMRQGWRISEDVKSVAALERVLFKPPPKKPRKSKKTKPEPEPVDTKSAGQSQDQVGGGGDTPLAVAAKQDGKEPTSEATTAPPSTWTPTSDPEADVFALVAHLEQRLGVLGAEDPQRAAEVFGGVVERLDRVSPLRKAG